MITLHSNLVIFQLSSEADIKSLGASFTFQSGYIPTRSTIKPLLNTKCLYIPIWLYSNGQGDLNCTVSCASLHSNLVIFQRLTSTRTSSSFFTLHSNLVIFQPCANDKIGYDQSQLYIPIWLYSNLKRSKVEESTR